MQNLTVKLQFQQSINHCALFMSGTTCWACATRQIAMRARLVEGKRISVRRLRVRVHLRGGASAGIEAAAIVAVQGGVHDGRVVLQYVLRAVAVMHILHRAHSAAITKKFCQFCHKSESESELTAKLYTLAPAPQISSRRQSHESNRD